MAIKIGEVLIQRGLITADQLRRALAMHGRSGARLGVCLVRLGYIDEQALAIALGEQLGVPIAPANSLDDVPPEVIDRVPRQVAEAHSIVPIRVQGREVHVCLADPQNLSRLDEIAFTLGCRIRPYLATELAIERALVRYYGKTVDAWQEAVKATGEWRLEQTGSRSVGVDLHPAPVEVVEAEMEIITTAIPFLAKPAPAPEPPPARPDADDPYEQLASVLTRADLVAAMAGFFGQVFANFCVLEIVTGGARCVALRRDGQLRPSSPTASLLPLAGAGWLRELLARPQIILRQEIVDTHLRELLEGLGQRPALISVVPVFDYGRLQYVLFGQGLTENEVKAIFGELKPYLAAVSEAMRMIALRDLIRKRARRLPAA
jgi:Type II secretion system (T2SS), protein E, N-terminal domain